MGWVTTRPFLPNSIAALQKRLGHHLQKPIIVLEALRCEYQWASDRLHRFVLQGMAHNRSEFSSSPITYYAYVETVPGQGAGGTDDLTESRRQRQTHSPTYPY